MFAFFLSWWGALLLAALDSSPFFFVPFGNDALLIYLAARSQDFFWMYALLATAGSLAGVAVSYWVGVKIGESGLGKVVHEKRLARLKARVKNTGAFAMALPAVLPPPFPLSAFVITAGALQISKRRFFAVFACTRAARFLLEAFLAHRFGAGVLRVVESPIVRGAIIALIALAVAGTIWTGARMWRQTRRR